MLYVIENKRYELNLGVLTGAGGRRGCSDGAIRHGAPRKKSEQVAMEDEAEHQENQNSSNSDMRRAKAHARGTASPSAIPAILNIVTYSAWLPFHGPATAIDSPI